MDNITFTPSSDRGQTGLEEALECLGNTSLWASLLNTAGDDDYDGPLARRFVSVTNNRVYGAANEYLGLDIGVGLIAALLLLICALLAGLTLAICGLDDTLIQLRAVTGTAKERKHAAVVARMKRHGTWMLCSLILCSCACGETFPFLLQILFREKTLFLAILISTLCLAIFAEILPQFIIPRNAIAWGYYCRPFVWACMILTSPISWPIAWLLDTIFGKAHQSECGIFSNDHLEELIHYHDETEKRGGQLGQDAARIAIGALKLDSQTIGAEMMRAVVPGPENGEMDLEKAEIIMSHGLIIKWSSVKTIKIDDFVDQAFLKKVKGWSYSRIPVISKIEIGPWVGDEKNLQGGMEDWDGTRIYGFLHTRSLIGVQPKIGLRVKDLPLYPLPIVRESMSVYELLNIFQLGMSRMAIVIANPRHDPFFRAEITPSVFHDPAEFSTMRWTATKRTNENIFSKMRGKESGRLDANNDTSSSGKANVNGTGNHQNVYGIRAPKPVGIVTFEDIIDTILQKTSRDEEYFFNPTKAKRAGDYTIPVPTRTKSIPIQNKISSRDLSPLGNMPPISVPKSRISPKKPANNGTLRFRVSSKNREAANNSDGTKAISNLDGAAETKHETLSSNSKVQRHSNRNLRTESSYTENSNGGFHGSNRTSGSSQSKRFTTADISNLITTSPYESSSKELLRIKSTSLPSRNTNLKERPQGLKHLWRNVSASPTFPASSSPCIPKTSRLQMIHYDGANEMVTDEPDLRMPTLSTNVAIKEQPKFSTNNNDPHTVHSCPMTRRERGGDESGETILTLSSWCESYYERENNFDSETLYDSLPITIQRMQDRDLDTITEERSSRSCDLMEESFMQYEGFPSELLDRGDENRAPNYISFTLPRLPDLCRDSTPVLEESFEDDRALLPSQRKALQTSMGMGVDVAPRCSSLWF